MWKNLPLKGCVYTSLGLNILSISTIIATKSFLPPLVPLFYGLPAGSGQLAPTLGLLIAPLTGLLVTLINIILTPFSKDQFFKKTLVISGTFVSILTTITTFKIILLVGFF